jgi:Tol biopolymer transport system component
MLSKLSKSTMLMMLLIFSAVTAWSEELQPIVYSGSGQLCSVSSDGNKNKCLDVEYSSPAWNPKGKQLVAETFQDESSPGPATLVLLDSYGNELKNLDQSIGFMRPVWGPDGGHIYALKYDLGPRLGRWDSDGKNFQFVPILGELGKQGNFQMLSFSPSGNRAALLNYNFNQIILAHLNDKAFVTDKKLIKGFNYVADSVWLDESHLLFVGQVKENGSSYLWEMNVDDGSTQRVVIPKLSLRDFLALSPDRKSVVVCATKDGEELAWSLWEFTLGSSKAKRLTRGSEDVEATWGK